MKRSVQHAVAAAVIGLGVTGGVALAQAPTTMPATTPAAGTATTQPAGQTQNGNSARNTGGKQGGQRQAPTTASVTQAIANLTQSLTSVKADRDFANGKMDLTTVNALLDKAAALQTQAQSALTANNLTLANGYGQAAEGAAHSADDLIVAGIGSTGLPSAANRPAGTAPANATMPTADQQKARASNELARAYQDIVNETNTVKTNSGAAGDLSFYVTTAQGLYKQAYDLYNAGKYDQASQTARAAQSVGHIADELLQSAGVTATGPTAVPVPAPNF
jgi:TolA-binding protein